VALRTAYKESGTCSCVEMGPILLLLFTQMTCVCITLIFYWG